MSPTRRTTPGALRSRALLVLPLTAAALLAVFATGVVVGRSVTLADQRIRDAWTQTVQPEEFAASILPFDVPEDVDDPSL